MTDTAIFIFGMFVFAIAIGASLISMIGASDSSLNPATKKEPSGATVAASDKH